MMYTLEFDGACEPINPGGTPAFGWLLSRNGKKMSQDSYVVPEYLFCFKRTNNVAEFYGLIEGLEAVKKLRVTSNLIVMGDSNLVINCVSGKWKTKAPHLVSLRDRAQFLIRTLEEWGWNVALEWIPREENSRADALSQGYG